MAWYVDDVNDTWSNWLIDWLSRHLTCRRFWYIRNTCIQRGKSHMSMLQKKYLRIDHYLAHGYQVISGVTLASWWISSNVKDVVSQSRNDSIISCSQLFSYSEEYTSWLWTFLIRVYASICSLLALMAWYLCIDVIQTNRWSCNSLSA